MAASSGPGLAANGHPPGTRHPLALLVLDLQSDFFFPTGKLASSAGPGFEDDSFASIVRSTRSLGTVIWSRTEFFDEKLFDINESTAGGDKVLVELQLDPDSSADAQPSFTYPDAASAPELFLTVGLDDEEELIAQPGSFGAGFIALAEDLLDEQRDDFLVKSSYSAFNATELEQNLKASGITALAICGSLSNVCVLATAADAVALGFDVTVIEDCLSYCSLNAHRDALTCMQDDLGVRVVGGAEYLHSLSALRVPTPPVSHERLASPTPSLSPVKRSDTPSSLHGDSSKRSSRKSLIPTRPPSALERQSSSQEKLPKLRTLNRKSSNQALLRRPSHTASPSTARSPLALSPLGDQYDRSASTSPAPHDKPSSSGLQQPGSRQNRLPVVMLGPGDEIGEGDSSIVHAQLHLMLGPQLASGNPDAPSKDLFHVLKDEVYWQKMYHVTGEVPRLVCAQGEYEPDGSMPLYRHPADESLPLLKFSKAVEAIRDYVQGVVGHPLNHCLVQLYRSGTDFISEHSDKTLDIVRGSKIVNVSLGAQRTMRLRTKKSAATKNAASPVDGILPTRRTQLVPMPHGSLFVMGPNTNTVWLHGINHDKRPEKERSEAEKAFEGERISLTFRHIGTFLDSKQKLIWGQGARGKTRATAEPAISGDQGKTAELITAFGAENRATDFDWEAHYGGGFNVLNYSTKPKERPLVFFSATWPADQRVRIYLEEFQLAYDSAGVAGAAAAAGGSPYRPTICLRDNDEKHTEVAGDIAILLYLERFHAAYALQAGYAQGVAAATLRLVFELGTSKPADAASFLDGLERQLGAARYLTGDTLSVADCIFWPLVDHVIDEKGDELDKDKYARIMAYHARMLERPSVEKAVWSDAEEGAAS